MINRTIYVVGVAAALTVFANLGAASAAPPGPDDAGYCGAHTDPLDCWADTGPVTAGEEAFIDRMRGQIPGDDTRLLQIARGTCQMLVGGSATWFIVDDVSEQLGVSEATADQVVNVAMDTACPGLVVGPDSVARPS
ncbi:MULTISPECIES: DUF732 domain-containing protein [unclassified Mycobacterium]|uniref:DUF732 domain-containing protein n=1 Tax=unclassified Mycobacterium TaxID=2642494 RepID=UPI0007400BBF|nr:MULTISPECIES: DUF732 domain-containing protein [unclassified Mycobacterium]KUH86481.1 hypothetical protein AU187_06940 [Mycobacterium sp. IS-1556]KUH86594.1 hypothetical protein AU185_18415 [Mycobacterium sp. GA-0227b]KUH91871.1 hypothetical protein AU186_05130 [Mycobacterium sp. GA-1999]